MSLALPSLNPACINIMYGPSCCVVLVLSRNTCDEEVTGFPKLVLYPAVRLLNRLLKIYVKIC